jgi:uncharacterized Fe-S cluster-containing radical SAM superfamily protein
MAKPTGPICNLDCRYCFYLEKARLYPGATGWAMPDAVLETFVRDYIAAHDVPVVTFAWQGGEPTLLGLDFFRRVVDLQTRYADGRRIENALQTNGILVDDRWAAFFAEHAFLVGLSIDGPREVHDRYRVDRGGAPTFDRVMTGMAALKRQGAAFNTLTVVHRDNARAPLDVYRFLKEAGSGFLQFIPIVERSGDGPGGPPAGVQGESSRRNLSEPGLAGRGRASSWSVPRRIGAPVRDCGRTSHHPCRCSTSRQAECAATRRFASQRTWACAGGRAQRDLHCDHFVSRRSGSEYRGYPVGDLVFSPPSGGSATRSATRSRTSAAGASAVRLAGVSTNRFVKTPDGSRASPPVRRLQALLVHRRRHALHGQ